MDSRIGQLVRDGRTIYYACVYGRYVERYTLADMEDCLAARDSNAKNQLAHYAGKE